MVDPVIALAFTAGMVATFNPCGFSLLPAYVAAFVASDDLHERIGRRMARAAVAAGAMAVAFVVVFTLVGVMVGTLAERVARQLPWITITVGSLLAVAGLAMVLGWKPTVRVPSFDLRRRGGRAIAMSIYGVTFAVASLSCTIGPFLAVTGTLIDRSTGDVVSAYVAYALGMGFMVLAIGLAVAAAHTALVTRMRRLVAHASKVGGVLMILAGLYVIWYARWELAVFGGNLETNPLIDAGEEVRAWLIGAIEAIGAGRLAVVTVVAVIVSLLADRFRRRTTEVTHDADDTSAVEAYEPVL